MNRKMIKKLGCVSLLSGLTALATVSTGAYAQVICIFDIGGASGDNYALMKDYALAAKKWGVDITLKPYSNESMALEDFKAGQCSGLLATSYSTRSLNSYTGSINAIGAIPTNSLARSVLILMGNPKLARDMVEGDYEAAGIIPTGSTYLTTRDRSLNSMTSLEGKRIGVLEIDPVQSRMAYRIGAKPVLMTLDNAGNKFKTNQIDILPAPSMAFTALEVYRSMGAKGGIVRFPLSFMTFNLILNKDEYPSGYGQKSRSWFSGQVSRLMAKVEHYDDKVPKKYWYDIPSADYVAYLQVLRQMRLEFVKNKTYNPRLMGLLKRLRCQQDSTNYECALNDE